MVFLYQPKDLPSNLALARETEASNEVRKERTATKFLLNYNKNQMRWHESQEKIMGREWSRK